MRQIGSLPAEAQARLFLDYLLSRGIRGEAEGESDRTWAIWIRDDDHIPEAQSALTRFQANPSAAEFQKATAEADKARKAAAEDLTKYRQRIRSRRSIFPKFGGYGIGWLTFTLMLICFYVAVASKLGNSHEWLRSLYISDPENSTQGILPEVFHGEIWRLFTPIFMHADILKDPLHLIFNMVWFYQLGSMIEARKSSLFLFVFIAVSAAFSDLAQYFYNGPRFVGMSGVVYALAGYVWMCGKYYPASGLALDSQSVTILLIWLVVCFTGLVGPIANAAHLVGLVTGVVWGRIAAYLAVRKPE